MSAVCLQCVSAVCVCIVCLQCVSAVCVCSVCLQCVSVVCVCSDCNILISGKIIKEMPGSAASGTPCTLGRCGVDRYGDGCCEWTFCKNCGDSLADYSIVLVLIG